MSQPASQPNMLTWSITDNSDIIVMRTTVFGIHQWDITTDSKGGLIPSSTLEP